MIQLLLISIGSFVGAISRFFISSQFKLNFIGTFIVNMIGSFIIVGTFILYNNEAISETVWLLISVGFCGAFTTFSTFSYETITLILNKKYKRAIIYTCMSLCILLSSFIITILFI